MNTTNKNKLGKIVGFIFSGILMLGTMAFAQPTTGFQQAGAGPWDYNTSTNWVDGVINGVWDSSLTLTAAQNVTFGEDTTLTTGLNFGYAGTVALVLRSDGAGPRTLTLGGDINHFSVGNSTITFGSTTANQGLNINLNGNREINLSNGRTLQFFNAITGGDLVLSSTNGTGATVKFMGDGAVAANSDLTITSFTTLHFDSSVAGNVGAVRAKDVTLDSAGRLQVTGNNNVASVNSISKLIIDGSGYTRSADSNSLSAITVRKGNQHTLFTMAELERESRGILFIRGDNLGVTSIASKTAGNTNIEVRGVAPVLVGGGGAAGSTTISILPWAVGGVGYGAAVTTFMTYTAANGFRPLDVDTEFASAFGGNATDNVRLTATTDTVLSGNATVNSLILAGQGGSLSGSGTLTVTSGAVLMTRSTGANSSINVNLNFGAAEGIFNYVRGDVVNGAIAGSGGLTIQGARTNESMKFTNGTSTYTGDTYILSGMEVSGGFLPSGERLGDVYVYGNLQLSSAGYNGSINGLNGNGTVKYGNSSKSTLNIGDNNANSVFDGSIQTNTNLTLSKIGTGTLKLNGDNAVVGAVNVDAGTFLVNQTLGTGAVTVAADAAFGGNGTIGGVTTVSAGAKLVPGADGAVGTLTFSNNLTVNGDLLIDVASATSFDKLSLGGTFTVGGALVLDSISGFNWGSQTEYHLDLFDKAFAGNFSSIIISGLVEGVDYTFDGWTDNKTLNLTVVPEPSTVVLLTIGGLLLAGTALRRRKSA